MKSEELNFDICFVSFTEIETDARTLNLARTYVKNGKSVCMIAHGTESTKDKFQAEGIALFPVKSSGKNRFWIKWIYFFINTFKYRKIVKAKFIFGMDFYSLHVANGLCKKNVAKLIYDSREIYSALGPLAKNKIKQKIISIFEKRLVANVSQMIVSGELDAEYLKNYFKHDLPYHIVKNLPPFKAQLKSDYIRKEFSLPSETVILLYQGMLMQGRGISPAVKALPFFEEGVLVLFGEGPYKSRIMQEAESLNVRERVIFAGVANYDELHGITCSADIGLSFIQPISYSYNLALPNKLFEYCMAGIPSLISNLPAMTDIVRKYPIGKVLPHDSCPKDIAIALRHLLKNKNEYRQACIEAAKIFSYESQKEIIYSIIA